MLIYVPALLSGMEFQIRKAVESDDYLWRGYDGSWFTDFALFQHPHVLTSYYYSGKISNYRKTLRIRDNVTLWADSGGYSVATKGAVIDPREVLEWQEANSNIAFTLDHPPTVMEGGNQTSGGAVSYVSLEQMRENAIKTAHNNDIFAKYRTNKDLLIYNVIHGNRLNYMEEWWKYNGIYDFEGYATGTKPTNNAVFQAFNIAFLHSKGVRARIHLLGVSGVRVIPALAYLSKYIERLSFDSTSYGRGALDKTYMDPRSLNDHISFGRKDYALGDIRDLSCTCPICSKIIPDDFAAEGTWSGMLVALHNLWAIATWTAELDAIKNDDKAFRKSVEEMTGEKFEESMTAKAIDFFEYYLKHGIEEAYRRYFPNKAQNEFKKRVLF